MNNKNFNRPFLLAGLIITLISFIVLTISSFYGIYAIFILGELSNSLNDTGLDSVMGILAISFVLVLVFAVLGIIFSSISLSRTRLSPEEFQKKRGLITTTIVFAIIIAVLEFIGLFSEFAILNLIFVILLIVAIVFMFIGRNKKFSVTEDAKELNNDISNQI